MKIVIVSTLIIVFLLFLNYFRIYDYNSQTLNNPVTNTITPATSTNQNNSSGEIPKIELTGKPCQSDKECQQSNLPGGGETAAVCYRNHCLNCTLTSIMCAPGSHSCSAKPLKNYPDWPESCVQRLTCCPD